MKKTVACHIIFTLYACFSFLFAQNAIIKGQVTDSKTKETLVGVHVLLNDSTGVVTDENGLFTLKVNPGKYKLTFRFIGFATLEKLINAKESQPATLFIQLSEEFKVLDEVVVTAGKYEQKLSNVIVSTEVIKPGMIESNNHVSLETAVNQIPGVMILGGQASIRGGSGYSYGVGSRVLVLVDGLPMLTAASGEVKWDFVPLENIEQVEIIKGASSSLFGSSALNGVINIRTAYPRTVPRTKFIYFSGIYDNPARDAIKWWGNERPVFHGASFSHSQMFGNLDVVAGFHTNFNSGYRENNSDKIARVNLNTRYRNKKIKGLSYGFNTNYMEGSGETFLIWKDGDSGVYQPSPSWKSVFDKSRFNVDPFIVYFRNDRTKYSLRTRYYRVENRNTSQQNNKDDLYLGELQFQKHYPAELTTTAGISASYIESIADLYGQAAHYGGNIGIYGQIDKRFKNIFLSAGCRMEGYKLDNETSYSNPVFRSGINYQLFEFTFLRGSFGQGYRFPTVAEKYTLTAVGDLKIFPNPNLKPEKGWSAETGIKQGFKVSDWKGYIDIAGFWTEYKDMIEFAFGQHYPDTLLVPTLYDFFDYTGFKSQNVSNARITGVDITITGQGHILGFPATMLLGYTYTNPVNLNRNDSTASTSDNILKYRFYHLAKADIEITHKKITAGISFRYNSFIKNIDRAFEDTVRYPNGYPVVINGKPLMLLPGLYEYRQKHNKGDFVVDLRFGWIINENNKVSIIIKNLLNREYMIRPADIQPPRNFTLQYLLKF